MKIARGFGPALAACLVAAPAAGDTPTLNLHGLLDLTLASRGQGLDENFYNAGTSNFDPYHVRLFVDSDLGEGFQVFTQLTLSEEGGIEPYGAYVLWTPVAGRDLHLEAGKIPMQVGTWAPRTYSNKNPLIGSPMMFQYHTSLLVNEVPADADALLGAAGSGQYGPDYGNGSSWKGMPIVYDRCWDYGAVLLGTVESFEYAVGITYGTPGVPVAGADWNGGKSVLGRVGLAPQPWLRVGVSGAYGPYLPDFVKAFTPALAGEDVDDFAQKLVMGDLAIESGHLEFRAEAFANTWETPTVGDLDVRGGYLEGKATMSSGAYVAARVETMRFGDLAGATIAEQPWDNDRDRYEIGAGYRMAAKVTAKAAFQRNVEKIPGQDEVTRDITALQLSVGF